jgi:hypothetical protein
MSARKPGRRPYGTDLRDLERLKEVYTAVFPSLERYVVEHVQRTKHNAEIAHRQTREVHQIKALLDETSNRIEADGIITESNRALVKLQAQGLAAAVTAADAAFDKVMREIRAFPLMLTPADMWEQSERTDAMALQVLLEPFKAALPPALCGGLNEILQRQPLPDHRHMVRWSLVFEGRHIKRLTW